MSILMPYDRERLREQFRTARPFPFIKIDNFLQPAFADEASRSFPTFEEALGVGFKFNALNENLKVQVIDYAKFPPPVQRLSDALSSEQFVNDLGYITGMPNLLWDPMFMGGGIHETARSGWLDVHVDFNFHPEMEMHRRLNILVYLNPVWEESWGGQLELWGDAVKVREHAFMPIHNRCIVFETHDTSWHGVSAVNCPEGHVRKSFAAYYYTREAPAGWDGTKHSTIFKARPEEYMKRHLLMPAQAARETVREHVDAAKQAVKRFLNRA